MKKICLLLSLLLTVASAYAMPTDEFDKGMEKGIAYFNKGMYYEARDEFQWFCDYNWDAMNQGQQEYALDYLDGTKAKIAEWEQYLKAKYGVYNGHYSGGGSPIPGTQYRVGVWGATITNTTASSLTLHFGQSESTYYVDNVVLNRQSNGSYYGEGYSEWGTSYITIWLETPQRISLTVTGGADMVGTQLLYKDQNY